MTALATGGDPVRLMLCELGPDRLCGAHGLYGHGTVCNLAARLCDEAKDGQILISRRVAVAVEEDAKLEEIGEVSLKGLSQAVAVYNVVQ
jgi:class 3 adenylate cyclase